MPFKKNLKIIFQSDWAISLIFLGLFFCTHGYRFGWDDQAAEIPHLKSLIDPALYTKDIFVISLKQYFPTYFYRILARLITIDQIPAVYLGLFIICRYFLFFWIYKFWRLITQQKSAAFFCTLTAMVLVREQHFVYLTFSHAEFTLPFIFSAIYFFHKDRFALAAAIFGIAVNFHALYGLYPMIYMTIYLLVTCRKHGIKTLLTSLFIFFICMSPFLIFMISTKASVWADMLAPLSPHHTWIELYHQYMSEHFFFPALPHKYSFTIVFKKFAFFGEHMGIYLFLLILYIMNLTLNSTFRQQLKSHISVLTAFLLLGICFISSYLIPNKFLIGLQLLRNCHFLLFFLPGYTTFLLLKRADKLPLGICVIISILLTEFSTRDFTSAMSALIIFLLLLTSAILTRKNGKIKMMLLIILLLSLVTTISAYIRLFFILQQNPFAKIEFLIYLAALFCLSIAIGFHFFKKYPIISKRLFFILTFILFTLAYCFAHYKKLTREKKTIDLIINAWEDIQRQTKKNTPKDAIILAPHDFLMGGFRIHSERNIIADGRDMGAFLTFNTHLFYQWQQRMRDIDEFQTFPDHGQNLASTFFNAVVKYKASYVVFTTNYQPKNSKALHLLYQNPFFILYKIN